MSEFFSNDWMHGIFVDNDRLKQLRNTALIFLGFEIFGSAGVLYHTQSMNDKTLTASAMYSLLFAILMLSNATKNQRDCFSSFMHSFSSKLTHGMGLMALTYMSQSYAMGGLTVVFSADALYGMALFLSSFSEAQQDELILTPRRRQFLVSADGSRDEKEEVVDERHFNNRIPALLREDELSQRLIGRGWKFNLFNVRGQLRKQLSALFVIASMFFFSLMGLFDDNNHQSLSMITMVYSLICAFSMGNISYVRDFDAL